MPKIKWTLEIIKQGIDSFILEEGRIPTAIDFDKCPYLPSARQVQRMYGGMAELRRLLGYKDIDFTKGDLRKDIASKAYVDGLDAEEKLEKILVARFGEAFVHTQKRYGKTTKNRYDFFIYAKNYFFGIDIFTTNRIEYIGPNIRHKLHRYKSESNVPIFFVVAGSDFSDDDINRAVGKTPMLKEYPFMKIVNEQQLIQHMLTVEPLRVPEGFIGNYEQK